MAKILVTTILPTTPERAFDLARSIDAHQISASGTQERAIAGRTSGLIELGETVTWRAKHFGIFQELTVRITEFDRPHHFADEMVRGAFDSMRHVHRFEPHPQGTLMTDDFEFVAPLGWLGLIAEKLFLTAYMRRFLVRRGAALAQLASSETDIGSE